MKMKKVQKFCAVLLAAVLGITAVPLSAGAEDGDPNFALNAKTEASAHYKDDTLELKPEYAVDGDMETRWASTNNVESAWIQLELEEKQTVNRIDLFEYVVLNPNIKSTAVEYKESREAEYQSVTELKMRDTSQGATVTFDDVEAQIFKITITLKESQPGINIKEIQLTYSEDVPEESDLITLEPSEEPNQYQQQLVDNGYTMFIHFGLNTFTEDEWTYGDKSPSVYAPTEIDADQWVKTAKEAGMKTVLLVSKHHDGFCLWDSQYTEYDVGNPEAGNHTDVIRAVSDACNKYGINLGIYYSAWDNNWDLNNGKENDAQYNQYMRSQITELLGGKYGLDGKISELWIDGNWEKDAERWEFDKLYDTVKRLQPECQMAVNLTIGTGKNGGAIRVEDQKEGDNIGYFPSDFRIYDGQETGEQDPKLFTHEGETYYLPFEATLIMNRSWFWHTGYGDTPSRSPESIAEKYNKYTSQDNILVLNCGPNRQGKIEQADIDSLYAAARILGIASGDALKKNYKEILNEYKGENAAAGADGASDDTYTGAYAEDYGPEKMFDGSIETRWATDAGKDVSEMIITLPEESTFNYVEIQEAAEYIRTDSVQLEYKAEDGSWQTAFAEEGFSSSGQLELRLGESITAKELRLRLTDAEKQGPTISEFRLYMIDEVPEMQCVPEELEVDAGKSAEIEITDTVENARFNALAAFTSGNRKIAEVDKNGVVTGVAAGKTEIKAEIFVLGVKTEFTIPVTVRNEEEPAEPAGKKTLGYFLGAAKAYVEDGAVSGLAESIQKMFADAIAKGEAVMADENASREEVLGAAKDLMLAIHALDMKAADKTDLEMALELAEMIDLTKYVEAGQAEYLAAKETAETVMEDGDAMQAETDAAWNNLVETMNALRLKADKSVLEDLVSQMEDLDVTGYTEESVSIFRAAMAAANSILEDESLSAEEQAKVEETVSALQAAYDGLEKVQGSGNQGSGNQGSGNQGSGNQDGGSQSSGRVSGAAKTGDSSPLMAMGIALVLSAGAVIPAVRKRVKK